MTFKLHADRPEARLQAIAREDDFLDAFPILTQLLNDHQAPITAMDALISWKASRKVGYRLYKAVLEDRIVGCIGLTELRDPLFTGAGFRINNFVIDRPMRGKGIADEIARAVAEIAKAEGKSVLIIETWPEHEKANRFYQRKFGFRFLCERFSRDIPL